MFAIAIILLLVGLALYFSPKDPKHDHSDKVHVAGQIGLIGALALFGVDYFSSFFYATGEMLHVLHPLGLQAFAWVPVVVVGLINILFGGLYISSLGPFNEGGGSYTASMRYLAPFLSLIVAVTLLEDYILTVVVSALSGADQFLSITGNFDAHWLVHFGLGAALATVTWFITIRGRGESASSVFMLLFVFAGLSIMMFVGLFVAVANGAIQPHAAEIVEQAPNIGSALFALLGASMKGLVALTGLEAMSNGIQFVKEEDAGIIQWAKKRFPNRMSLWNFYSGKVGIGRLVQSSFLFYGGITTALAALFAVHFGVFDGTDGRTLIGNLANIGFSIFPNGNIMFGAYQLLSVFLLAAASMTAFQDMQATEWRDVAIGQVPQFICYRDAKGTFTRSVTATWVIAVLLMLLFKGNTSHAIPFYGVGVFLPIAIMGFAMRKHVLATVTVARLKRVGALVAGFAGVVALIVFMSQLFARWEEGGWVRILTFTSLFAIAHLILISPFGKRTPEQIRYIVRDLARVQGSMASIVEWQSLRMQEYRYYLLKDVHALLGRLGIKTQVEVAPAPAGPYDTHHHF